MDIPRNHNEVFTTSRRSIALTKSHSGCHKKKGKEIYVGSVPKERVLPTAFFKLMMSIHIAMC